MLLLEHFRAKIFAFFGKILAKLVATSYDDDININAKEKGEMKDLAIMNKEDLENYIISVVVSEELSFEQKNAELHRIYEEGIISKGKAIAKKHGVRARIPAYADWLWQVKNITMKGRS